jgi:mono/diheme cytochrome c family protein
MKTSVKGFVLALALSLCAGYFALPPRAGARPQAGASAEASGPLTPERMARAKRLFGEKCARCHGPDGRGKTVTGDILGVPDFTDARWWDEEKSDRRLVASVTEGRAEMPAFGKKLSRQEIAALVAYVRRFNEAAR